MSGSHCICWARRARTRACVAFCGFKMFWICVWGSQVCGNSASVAFGCPGGPNVAETLRVQCFVSGGKAAQVRRAQTIVFVTFGSPARPKGAQALRLLAFCESSREGTMWRKRKRERGKCHTNISSTCGPRTLTRCIKTNTCVTFREIGAKTRKPLHT